MHFQDAFVSKQRQLQLFEQKTGAEDFFILQAFAFIIGLHGMAHLFRLTAWSGVGLEIWHTPMSRLGLTPTEILLLISALSFVWIVIACAYAWRESLILSSRIICVAAVICAAGVFAYAGMMQLSKPRFVALITRWLESDERILQEDRARLMGLGENVEPEEVRWQLIEIAAREKRVRENRAVLQSMTAREQRRAKF